ncbi:MAG: ribosome small subunit-dependent GTPase A [Erysipelotrichales bacterium]|nr:ribosome small subunit-dependent GTPase A [Erysipelotrichales bacterium]
MNGIVLSSRYGTYEVLTASKTVLTCKPRGLFRHKQIKLVVGDRVTVDEKEEVIIEVEERKNYLIRPSIANVDELAIVMSVKEPDFSSLLIDKFIAYANFFKIKANVIISKVDKSFNAQILKDKIDALEKVGVHVIEYSQVTKVGLDEIEKLFSNKIVALMGQTGVGKSSLLNSLVPSSKREIGEFSKSLGRGKHQTKEVVLIPYENGFIADTPGFSSLELPLYKEDLAQCFVGFEQYYDKCKFSNCLHIHEKDCEVKKAVEEGKIANDTYQNYLKISEELILRKDRF